MWLATPVTIVGTTAEPLFDLLSQGPLARPLVLRCKNGVDRASLKTKADLFDY